MENSNIIDKINKLKIGRSYKISTCIKVKKTASIDDDSKISLWFYYYNSGAGKTLNRDELITDEDVIKILDLLYRSHIIQTKTDFEFLSKYYFNDKLIFSSVSLD